jgi:two-component system CheB/CheR fusion protein
MTINQGSVQVHASYHLEKQPLISDQQGLPQTSERRGQSEETKKERRRALVVDDVADVTEMLSILLSHAGYDVTTASSAGAALASARNEYFDIIISDIGMPEMNGYELVQALRNVPGYEAIPMIALTGYSMFNDREKSLNSGFTAHMTKPIDPRALLELIEQL